VIALKRACARRSGFMVVLYNPRKEDAKMNRVWPWFWRVALASCIACLVVAYLLK
jgi:hypothetical protein